MPSDKGAGYQYRTGKTTSCFASIEILSKQVVVLGVAHCLPSNKIEYRFTCAWGCAVANC